MSVRSEKRKGNKKRLIVIIIIIIAVILLFPIKFHYKDGGSVEYKSIVYSVFNYHTLEGTRGTTVRLLGFKIFDNTYMFSAEENVSEMY